MSEELQKQVITLQAEIDTIKAQAAQNNQAAQSLVAQLESHKHYLNDTITGCLNLRTHLVLAQKRIAELEAAKG
jgi:capsule polysaccharide export protein KpsE/RkpR